MGTPINPATTVVKVAADSSGTPGSFATIADMDSWGGDHGAEDPIEAFVFGEVEPHTRGGDVTDDYSISGLYNVADTNGQNVLKNSRDSGVACWIQVLLNGTDGYQQKINVTSYGEASERQGDWVTIEFSARGVAGTMEEVPES